MNKYYRRRIDEFYRAQLWRERRRKLFFVVAWLAVVASVMALAMTNWELLNQGWAFGIQTEPQLEKPPAKPQTGMIYVIQGEYSRKNIIAQIPLDPSDNIGSVNKCFEMLAWKKGFCTIPGELSAGKHSELKRPLPEDANVYIAGQRFDR